MKTVAIVMELSIDGPRVYGVHATEELAAAAVQQDVDSGLYEEDDFRIDVFPLNT